MLEAFKVTAAIGETPWADVEPLADATRWYAVQCQPHRERIAAAHLANQDFRVFLPLREKTRRHARKIETVKVPFFPGYLFVQLDLSRDRWRSVNGTLGVVHLVMQGLRPLPAPEGIVEALKANCDEDGLLFWAADLVPGQAVRVLNGPFADFIGELERMTDTGRLRVLLDIMGGRTPVLLPRGTVVAADSIL
jgi:transcriptional antiterminator RfaH